MLAQLIVFLQVLFQLLWPIPAWAQDYLVGTYRPRNGAPATPVSMRFANALTFTPSGTQYTSLSGPNNAAGAAQDDRATVVAAAGTFTEISCTNTGGLSDVGEDITLTLDLDTGGGWGDTELACTLVGTGDTTDKECVDTGSVAVSAGDRVVFKQTFTGTPTAGEDCNGVSAKFVSTADNTSLILGTSLLNSTAVQYVSVGGRTAFASTLTDVISPVPDTFTVSAFYVDADANLTNARTFYVCYDDDGATDAACNSVGRTLMSCAVSGGTQTCSDTSCNQASCEMTAANEIFLATDSSASAENKDIGWGIALTNASQRWPSFSYVIADSGASSRYFALNNGDTTGSGLDSHATMATEAMTALQMYVWHDGNLSAGTKDFSLYVADSASAESCQLTTSVSECSDTDDVAVSDGNSLFIGITPASSPAANNSSTSISWSDLD